jgi:hypothetical protein
LAAPPRGRGGHASARRKSALAAADGGMWGWLQQQRPTHRRSLMPRAANPDFSEASAVPVGSGVSLRAAIGEHGLRRRPCRWAVTWRYAGARPDGRARVAGTHRPSGATASINPGRSRSPLNAVSGWKHGLVITHFARFINSKIALRCEWQGATTHGDPLVGSGGTHEEIARALEGGFVGRALHLPQRAALEPLDPSSGDRLVGSGVPPRADRAITRRRGRRPRAWGEARGPQTSQSRPLMSRTRGAA